MTNWDDLMAIAGCMGWSQREFLCSSLRFFLASWRGYQRTSQDAWERARWMSWLSLQPYTEKNQRFELTDIIVFPWEPEPTPRWVINDEVLAWLEDFGKEADEFYLQHRAISDQQAENN